MDLPGIFVFDNWTKVDGNIGSRLAFLRDGTC